MRIPSLLSLFDGALSARAGSLSSRQLTKQLASAATQLFSGERGKLEFWCRLGKMSISSYANQLPGRGHTQIRSREGSTREMESSSELQFLQAKSRAKRNVGGGNFLFQTKRITPRVTSRFRRLAPQVDKYYRHKSQGKLSLLYKV